MVKRFPGLSVDAGPSKRRKGSAPEAAQKGNCRLISILEPLLQSGTLTDGGSVSGQPSSGPLGRETLLSRLSLPQCTRCAFHLCHGTQMAAESARQRVSPWAWPDVKQLVNRRCIHSLTVQHSKDGERVLIRGFVHAPHDDVEVCSCNGTPTAARVCRAAVANGRPAGAAGSSRSAANPDGKSADGAAATGGSVTGTVVDDGERAMTAGLAAPGTCGPPDRSTHVVEVLLSTADWSLQSCSSSCCGVGYDALQSQLCPMVAAVLLAARVSGGSEVLCEHDYSELCATAAVTAASECKASPQAAESSKTVEPPPGTTRADTSSGAANTPIDPGGSSVRWAPQDLGLGPPPLARILASASGGALVLGPNYVDPPAPLAPSLLPGPGQPLGLQRELDCPRLVPELLRPHLVPCGRPVPAGAGAGAGAGPSTSTARPAPVSEPAPVPPPHVPVLPAAESGSRANARYPGGYSASTFPSATARAMFCNWYRESVPIVTTGERFRESYRMLLAPEEPAASAENPGEVDLWAASARRPATATRQSTVRRVKLPPTSWSFGAGGGLVSLEMSGAESAERFISARACDRGPVWEARMSFLTSHAAVELDPELRMQSSVSDTPDPWPPAVLAAFDEACSPVGQPAGANGPAGALCALLRIMWMCLHLWEMDLGLARRAKLVVQAICKLLVVADLPAYLRCAAARLLGGWRLKLGDASAHGRRAGYGSSNDVTISDMLTRLTTAYLLARDSWDAPHVLGAMGFDPDPSHAPAATSMGATHGAAALGPTNGRLVHEVGSHSQLDGPTPSTAGGSQGNGSATASTKGVTRPDLQPTWMGFKPANQAAVRLLLQQQHPQQAGQPAGGAGGAGGGGPGGFGGPRSVVAPVTETFNGLNSTQMSMSFVPYAPPPLQGVATMSTPSMQEVVERLHWLEHFGLDGPYVSLAAVSGEWSKAIKMLLRRGSKSDVERACRLAVERLSSAAAKAQQACFLLHQVLGPPQQASQKPGSETGGDSAAPTPTAGPVTDSAAAAAAGGAGAMDSDANGAAGGVDSLVVSAVARLPPTFVAGCAGRMFMSAVRAALSIKIGNESGAASSGSSNAAFEMSFLRTSASAGTQNDAASPAAALLAAIKPSAGGPGGTRPSPYTALLRSVIALVAENQEREWRAEEESLRDLGLLDELAAACPANNDVNDGGRGVVGSRTSGSSGSREESEVAGSVNGISGTASNGGAATDAGRVGPPVALEYVNALAAVMRHNAMRAAMPQREEHCDCDACRRDRRERLAMLASEMPPGTVQYTKLRAEDICFVTDPAVLSAFSKAVPLIPTRAGPGGAPVCVPRVHSLAVLVVRSVFHPMMAVLADPEERPRTPAEYASLLATVEESMAGLCDDVMPERVQLQAVLEGVTVSLCALYCCHHVSGASPSALGRVVTDLLSAGQLELARQVAACQLALSRSADSLAHTLEVAVASGEEAQAEAALELLRTAARDPPVEQRLMAAALIAGRGIFGMDGPDIHMGGHGILPGPPYLDDSSEYDSDDYTDYFSGDDDDDDSMDNVDMYGAFMLGFPYRDVFYPEQREEVRQRRREERRQLRENRQTLRAMLLEAHQKAEAVTVARAVNESDHDLWGGSEDGAGGNTTEAAAVTAAGAGGGGDGESDVDTEDLLAALRRGRGHGGGEDGEEAEGPVAMYVDHDNARMRARAEKAKSPTHVGPASAAGLRNATRHGEGQGGGGGNEAHGGSTGRGTVGAGSPGRSHLRRRRAKQSSDSPPHGSRAAIGSSTDAGAGAATGRTVGGGGGGGDGGGDGGGGSAGAAGGGSGAASEKGPHELAMLLVQCSPHNLCRRLMKVEGDQNLFALAQYIRGRGACAELVAPLMAGAVVCLEQQLRNYPSNTSMQGFASEMMNSSTAPLRHPSRLETRIAEGPCLKGLPAASWQAFFSARSYRYATDRDEAGQLREVVVLMENHNPLILTAWVCAAFSAPADLPGRRRVLSAMALAASRRYGPSLAHLGLALARVGLREAAVTVAARALASTASDYMSFTHGRANSHSGSVPPLGQLPWYAACLLELAPVFIEVLEQVTSRQQQPAGAQQGGAAAATHQKHLLGSVNGAAGGSCPSSSIRTSTAMAAAAAAAAAAAGARWEFPRDAEAEAAAAVEAEAQGRGVGEWRLPRLEISGARTAVANFAVTLLLLRCELPPCLLGCGEAVTAVMALLSKVAIRNNIKHEQLFEGGGAGGLGTLAYDMGGQSDANLRGWVVAAMRECLLGPLRSASRDVQQAFVTAVATMPDNELDFKMKIPLLEWARGARVPVSTIFDAASRAVASATRILENELNEERSRLALVRMELIGLSRSWIPLRMQLVTAAGAGGPTHVLAKIASLGVQTQADVAALVQELDRALMVGGGQGGVDAWIEDKRTPSSWAISQLSTRQVVAPGHSYATSGHRSWVWHVLKWVGERLLEEMVTGAAAASPEATGAAGGGRGRRGGSASASASRDTSPGPQTTSGPDPRVMLKQLVERTGQFRGPELLPLACTLLDVVAYEGSTSAFAESARQLLARAVLPEAGRASSLATHDAWCSPEFRVGLRRVLDRWRSEREAAAASPPSPQLLPSGRPRRAVVAKALAASGGSASGGSNSPTVTDDLAERVALTLVLSEGCVASLLIASAVLDFTRPAGAAAAASSSVSLTASPTLRGSSRASGGSGGAAVAADQLAGSPRLELRLPVQHAEGGSSSGGAVLELGGRHPVGLQPFSLGLPLAVSGWAGQGGGGTRGPGVGGPGGPRAGADVLTLDLSVRPLTPVAAPLPTAGGRRSRGSNAAAAAAAAAVAAAAAAAAAAAYRYPEPPDISIVDEDWEDRGQISAVTMSAAAGWAMERLSLHGALRSALALGALELPYDDPKAAAILRFLQVQAAPPTEALAVALAPLGPPNPPGATGNNGSGNGSNGAAGSSEPGGSGSPTNSAAGDATYHEAAVNSVSRRYSPRYTVAVWRLVLQLMRRDQGLLAGWRAASTDMDLVHRALQVGTRALAPSTSASRSLTWQHRMDAPSVTALSALKPPHVRCAVVMLRVWMGSRWLLGTCRTPPQPQPQPGAAAGVGGFAANAMAALAAGSNGVGDGDIPMEEKEPAVALLVDDLIRLHRLNPDLAIDCIRDNATKFPYLQATVQSQAQAQAAGPTTAQGASSLSLCIEAALVARLGGRLPPPPGVPVAGGASGSTANGGQGAMPGPGSAPGQGPTQLLLNFGSALLNCEEIERLSRLEGFVAALGEHVRSNPAAKKVLSVLQPRLPQLGDKVLRFLHKHRMNGATREALAAKLARDFKVDELDAMRAQHLPWTPAPGGTKATRAAELAEWIAEHQAEYLEQQGAAAPHRRRMADMLPYFF